MIPLLVPTQSPRKEIVHVIPVRIPNSARVRLWPRCWRQSDSRKLSSLGVISSALYTPRSDVFPLGKPAAQAETRYTRPEAWVCVHNYERLAAGWDQEDCTPVAV